MRFLIISFKPDNIRTFVIGIIVAKVKNSQVIKTRRKIIFPKKGKGNMSRPRLEGKIAVVTGGAAGIGEAVSLLFKKN